MPDVYPVQLNPVEPLFPLPLGNIITMAKKHYPELSERLNFQTPWLTERDTVTQKQFIDTLSEPSVFLMSDYVWNTNSHNHFSKLLKQKNQDHIIIHGGPSVPVRTTSFLDNNPYADFAVHGEGEITCMELLNQIFSEKDYHSVKGISFRQDRQVVMTEPRERISDLSLIPSPYLCGNFDNLLFATPRPTAAILETNRGCPYKCTFCDWGGGTLQKIRTQDFDTVFEEIEWIAYNGIPSLWIADANFGIFERDIEITEHICKMKEQYGFPTIIIVTFAKTAKLKTSEIIRMLISAKIFASVIISVQTLDENTLKAVRRKNMKREHYMALTDECKKNRLPAYAQLMIGLPGSTYELFKQDLDKFLREKLSFMILTTVVLPNSPMAQPEYRKEHGIVTDIFRNETGDEHEIVVAANSYSREEFRRVNMLNRFVYFAICNRALKYVAYTVAVEKQTKQTDFLETLTELGKDELAKKDGDLKYPVLREVIKELTEGMDDFFVRKRYIPENQDCKVISKLDKLGRLDEFYEEIRLILQSHYGIDERIADTVIKIQKRILPSLHNPLSDVNLDYDFVSYYFQDTHNDPEKSLLSFSTPKVFSVKDPKMICSNFKLAEALREWGLYSELDSDLWRNE